ncbi:MAG TPA: terminase family protein [Sphingomicrobium sp.]|nr:terminase family protein [Sphingomicrobium sp.]
MSYSRYRRNLANYVRRLRALPIGEQRALLAKLSPRELLMVDALFEAWAHDGQLPPCEEGWSVWLMLAGRGFGKTRAGAEWIYDIGWSRPVRIALVGANIDEARRIMIEGAAGLLSIAKRWKHRLKWEPSKSELTWPRGTVATLYSGDNPDGLRGPEHAFAWCDELAKWRHAQESWDNLQMGLRGGIRPRALITTTPRPMALLEQLRKQPWTVETGGKTKDNINLPRNFVDVMLQTYGGTRLGRQELDGELIADVEGALWTKAMIEKARVGQFCPERQAPSTIASAGNGPPPRPGEELSRIVVGVDPPAGTDGDECGIVVCGRDGGGTLHVLEDASVGGLSPEGWANRAAAAVARWGASLVVAEANNGGLMVKSVLDAAEVGVRVKLVHASRGKAARAEPVALRFERGRAKLAGDFPKLEAQMAGMTAGGGYQGPGRSPDRCDAMVWAMTELGETKSGLPRVVRL